MKKRFLLAAALIGLTATSCGAFESKQVKELRKECDEYMTSINMRTTPDYLMVAGLMLFKNKVEGRYERGEISKSEFKKQFEVYQSCAKKHLKGRYL